MKSNMWLCSIILASSSLMTVTHAGNSTRVAATSALGSVVGTAIGQQLGGQTGAMIGSAIGGAGGESSDQRSELAGRVEWRGIFPHWPGTLRPVFSSP